MPRKQWGRSKQANEHFCSVTLIALLLGRFFNISEVRLIVEGHILVIICYEPIEKYGFISCLRCLRGFGKAKTHGFKKIKKCVRLKAFRAHGTWISLEIYI